jgi:hypothetical protein
MALYRTFAIPRIAELLHHTGEIERHPAKRSMDTGLLMYELIDGGVESDRGREVIRALNRMHRRWPILEEDYAYVLTTFIVVPARWSAAHGLRPYTPEEETAATVFYREVGRRMGIRALPASYDEAAQLLDSYEASHLAWSAAGAALMASADDALKVLLPRPLRGASSTLTGVMLDDRMCDALGVRRPPWPARWTFARMMDLRRAKARHRRRPPTAPIFTPGVSGSAVYPTGYRLTDLGVPAPEPPPYSAGISDDSTLSR